MNQFIYYFDLFGTGIFAVSGAMAAIKKHLDLLGVIVLACSVGVGGGILRDTMVGRTPVMALRMPVYLLLCVGCAVLVFCSARYWMRFRNIIKICDAVGLGVFTFIGADVAERCGLNPLGIIFCGTITAVGGGVVRDMLLGHIPVVLRSDFYATASLLGGLLFLCTRQMELLSQFLCVSVFTMVLRLLAIYFRIKLPSVQIATWRNARGKTSSRR